MPPRSHPSPPVPPAALNAADRDAMWTNLGEWSASTQYHEAAPALAMRVGMAAALRADDVVVDYACGYGDSLRLWIDRFDVRRVVGVEPDPALCRIVRGRIIAWGLEHRIAVVESRAEALPPRSAAPDATAVVCVDAAYHFASRLGWWRMCSRDLAKGARIAAADLLLADGRRAGLGLRAVARAMRIPTENLMDRHRLQRELSALDLHTIAITPCGDAVLDGFAQHAPARHLGLRVTRAVIRRLRRAPAIEYAIVAAECQSVQ